MGGLGGSPVAYDPPRPIRPEDDVSRFDCGRSSLDDFLRRRAVRNEGRASRTYVVRAAAGADDWAVVAYYALAAGAARLAEMPKALTRNMPDPMPLMILGRLAVDRRHKGRGLGRAMLKEALQRALEASRLVGARALVVHAIDDEAAAFYARYGFQPFPAGGRTLWLPMETIAAAL